MVVAYFTKKYLSVVPMKMTKSLKTVTIGAWVGSSVANYTTSLTSSSSLVSEPGEYAPDAPQPIGLLCDHSVVTIKSFQAPTSPLFYCSTTFLSKIIALCAIMNIFLSPV
jgi:hypothetical protein